MVFLLLSVCAQPFGEEADLSGRGLTSLPRWGYPELASPAAVGAEPVPGGELKHPWRGAAVTGRVVSGTGTFPFQRRKQSLNSPILWIWNSEVKPIRSHDYHISPYILQ